MQNRPFPKFFIALSVGLFAMWAIFLGAGLKILGTTHGSIAEIGQLGDMFGILNSLFSGLAFLGVVYAIYQENIHAKEQDVRHTEEKEREEMQFRRIKFEEVILNLDAAYRSVVQLQGEIGTKYLGNKDDSLEMFRAIDDAFAKARLLALLYFQTLVEDLSDLRDVHTATLKMSHEFCNSAISADDMRKPVNRLVIKTAGERSITIQAVSKHLALPFPMR